MQTRTCKSRIIIRWVLTGLLALLFAAACFAVWNGTKPHSSMFLYRAGFLLALCSYAGLHIWIPVRKLYGFIFRYRVLIAAALFVVLLILQINFSSIGMFGERIQPSSGNDFTEPVIGAARGIRSDEWAISTPRTLSFRYCKTNPYNDIFMGIEVPNIAASGMQLSLSALSNPLKLGYFVSPSFGLSFYWCGLFILAILSFFELFLILTERKILVSCLGTALTVFSGFYMWWSMVSLLTYAVAATVCIWYFINAKTTFKRIIFGILLSVSGASFVCSFYPAWQVPLGYCFLGIIIWMVIKSFKSVKSFGWTDWLVFAGVILFTAAIIGKTVLDQREYVEAISNTVYPGAREDCGGYKLYKLFLAPLNFKFPFEAEVISPCENATFLTFFPLPFILSAYALIKKKGRDSLLVILLTVSVPLFFYCTTGLPYSLAKIMFLTYSTAKRAVDVFAFLQVILLIRSAAVLAECKASVPVWLAVVTGAAVGAGTAWVSYKYYPEYADTVLLIVFAAVSTVAVTAICCVRYGKFRAVVLTCLTVALIADGLAVNPVQKGADVIYSKPVANVVSELAENNPDAKWIAVDQSLDANFYAACGAKVLNSNNFIPNTEMWETVFPDGENEEKYNRYANLNINITDGPSELTLGWVDSLSLQLNYMLLDDLGVKYLVSKEPLTETYAYMQLEEIYAEDGIFIYETNGYNEE